MKTRKKDRLVFEETCSQYKPKVFDKLDLHVDSPHHICLQTFIILSNICLLFFIQKKLSFGVVNGINLFVQIS